MTKKTLLLILGLALLLPVACTGGDAQQSEFVQHDFPIINGVAPDVDAELYKAVVSLHQRTGDSVSENIFCSGTLIAPDVVLTAAHCLDVGNRKPRTMSPSAVAIHFGPDPTDPNSGREFYWVSETWMHPAYNSFSIANDIAMLRLEVPNNTVTPVPALPASLGFAFGSDDESVWNSDRTELISAGIDLDFAGFGQDQNGEYNQKLHFVGMLDYIQSASQIYYLQGDPVDGGPCFGDSGGPAFVVRSGKTYVGGMTSYGDSSCSIYGVSTRADYYEALINDFVGTVVEPPPAPDCSEDGECNSDCAEGQDPDCTVVEPPDCAAKGEYCSAGSDCCSGLCHPRKHYCK